MKYRYSVYNDSFGISIFVWGFFVSLLLFIFIFYFAVNKTYVYIHPEIKIETRSSNFVFKTRDDESIFDGDKTITLERYEETIALKKEFSTTGIQEESTQKATWEIVIYNHLDERIDLKVNTRVRRENGIEYIILSYTRLPPAQIDENGTIQASQTTTSIQANNYDATGKFIWSRWNISDSVTLIIPGLPEDLRSKIYAKTHWEIQWWSDEYERILHKDDIKKATQILETQLKNEVIQKANKAIAETNTLNNTSLSILWVNNAIEYSDPQIHLPVWISPGHKIENFILSWNISVHLYLFDKQWVINKLKKTINDSILENVEELIMIDKESLRVSNVIYSRKDPIEIKATSEVEILLQHNFLNPHDSFVQKLKNTIIGMDKKQAEIILRNNEKIQDIKIENRPFFLQNISNIPANIIFKIDQD